MVLAAIESELDEIPGNNIITDLRESSEHGTMPHILNITFALKLLYQISETHYFKIQPH